MKKLIKCCLYASTILLFILGCSRDNNENQISKESNSNIKKEKQIKKPHFTFSNLKEQYVKHNKFSHYRIDRVNNKSTKNKIVVSSNIPISIHGWAITPNKQAYLTDVYIIVDGKNLYKAKYGINKPKNKILNKLKLSNAGFSCIIPSNTLKKGKHAINIITINNNKYSPQNQKYSVQVEIK